MKLPKIDLNKKGLSLVFKPYMEVVVDALWEKPEKGWPSGKMWKHVCETLGPKENGRPAVSRASVIFGLNWLVDDIDLCRYESATGKGGHHRIYYVTKTKEQFWKWLANLVITKLVEGSELEDLLEELFMPSFTENEETHAPVKVLDSFDQFRNIERIE